MVPWDQGNPRLKPPDCLGELEKRAFLALVCSCPLGQFQASDSFLAELVVVAEQAHGEMRATGVVVNGKPSPWWDVYCDATKELRALALRLRLGPQSRASKAPKTLPARMSVYERLALEEDGDDADQGRN